LARFAAARAGCGCDPWDLEAIESSGSRSRRRFRTRSVSTSLDDLPHLALVETDERGLPTGPVLELDEGFRGSEDERWEAWRARLPDVG